ncbi:hypothetical protein [Novosphingobium terrae]|uniref:hypothetical protein n=1 Tax=Novosphingobium terrae TaxID=2726189 RepID=UPI00197D9D62|nr:hypothetical protein [Novosphingobium terrae]
MMMNRFGRIALAITALAGTTMLHAQEDHPVAPPDLKTGDAWVFDDIEEKGTTGFNQHRLDLVIESVGGAMMTVGVKPDGAPTGFQDHLVGADWSQRRLLNGQQSVTTQPFRFPMAKGHQWTVDFTDPTRRGNQLSAHIHRTYTVAGWVDVSVPAGHFRALEVVAEGVDEAMIQVPATASASAMAVPGGSASISAAQRGGISKLVRGTHAELYYVPGVKNYVKSVEEQYNTDNVRVIRHTQNLVSFTPAG